MPDSHEEREWVRDFWSALRPWHEGVYVNFLGDEGAERVQAVVRAEEVRPAPSLEAKVRPGQLLPHQPEHPAQLAGRREQVHRPGSMIRLTAG